MKKFWLWGGIGGLLSFAIPPAIFFGVGIFYWGVWAEALSFLALDAEFKIIVGALVCFAIGATGGLLIGKFIKNVSIGKTVSLVIVVYVIVSVLSMVILPKLNASVSESRINDFSIFKNSINSGIGSVEQVINNCDLLERNYGTLCIEELALREKDPLICKYNYAVNAYDGTNCITKVFKANPSLRDVLMCESFSNTDEKGVCIQGVAINRLDSSLCSKAGYIYADGCRLIVEDLKSKNNQ